MVPDHAAPDASLFTVWQDCCRYPLRMGRMCVLFLLAELYLPAFYFNDFTLATKEWQQKKNDTTFE